MSTEDDVSINDILDDDFASQALTQETPALYEPGQQPPPPDVEAQDHRGDQTPPADRQQQAEEAPRMVPLPELIETRKRAQEAERAAQDLQQRYQQLERMVQGLYQQQAPQEQQQPQQPVIDPFEDPQAYARSIEERVMHQVQHAFLSQQLDASERRAFESYGQEQVDEAFEAARQVGIAQVFINQPDPYGELVKWHRSQQLLREVGDDPEAYKKQLMDQIRQELLAETQQGNKPAPSNLPPSLSTATKASTSPQVVTDDQEFFRDMMNRRG